MNPFRSALLRELKRLNTRLNDLEALSGVAEVQALPCHLEVDFSSRCNYRCPMCHQSKLDMGRFELGPAEIDAIVDSLPYRETVMIAGLGEPLLYPGLGRFLPYLKRYRCGTHLFTNGELIDSRLGLIKDIDRISVSLDGATAATFETLRKGGHFDKVVANIRALRAAAPKTCLTTSTMVSKVNLREIAAIVALAGSLSMQQVHLSAVEHTPFLALDEDDEAVFREQLELARRQNRSVQVVSNLLPMHFGRRQIARVAPADSAKGKASRAIEADGASELWPDGGGAVSREHIHGMGTVAELKELVARVARHRRALHMLKKRTAASGLALALPYCSAPWKYAFARSRGDARVCPFADLDVGRVASLMGQRYNSPLLVELRGSMALGQPCLSVCGNCTDDHRQFRRDSMLRSLGVCPTSAAPRSNRLLSRMIGQLSAALGTQRG